MAAFTSICRSSLLKCNYRVKLGQIQSLRALSTSKKKKEVSVTVPEPTSKEDKDLEVKAEGYSYNEVGQNKNWISYGFDYEDEVADNWKMHVLFFSSLTCVLIGGSFLIMYMPDFRLRDWAQREAYLEMRRRESLGLTYIDRNYCDPATITLPTEEELEDVEIII